MSFPGAYEYKSYTTVHPKSAAARSSNTYYERNKGKPLYVGNLTWVCLRFCLVSTLYSNFNNTSLEIVFAILLQFFQVQVWFHCVSDTLFFFLLLFFVVFQFIKCQSLLVVMNTILVFVFLVLFMGAAVVPCI